MKPRDLTVFTLFLHELVDASGAVITPLFRSPELAPELKRDRTVVTQADRNAELRMRELIRARFPDHGILGEEFGPENTEAEFVWSLDPVDGTISFVSGCPLVGTLVGLLHQGEPVLGCIDNPLMRVRCIGDGSKTTVNGAEVRCRPVASIEAAFVCTTDVKNVGKFRPREGFDRLVERAHSFRTWGDCFGYLLLAEGAVDVMIDPMMNPWDVIPLVPIIRGAGGEITAWDGGPAATANSCVAAAKEIHAEVLKLLDS